jgi:hypothetical protein
VGHPVYIYIYIYINKEDIEKDLRAMKFRRWRQKAVDAEECSSVIKEAKDLRGP